MTWIDKVNKILLKEWQVTLDQLVDVDTCVEQSPEDFAQDMIEQGIEAFLP